MPSREYHDPSGTRWEVFEVHRLNDRPDAVRPALTDGWLAFVSAGEKRRLPNYPSDWLERSDDELHELLRQAILAPEPIYPVLPFDPAGSGQTVERRRRPRITPRAAPAQAPPRAPAAPLDAAEVEALVREHARQARRDGTTVIEGMLGVKRALGEAGAEVSPTALRELRKVFVDEFYFAR